MQQFHGCMMLLEWVWVSACQVIYGRAWGQGLSWVESGFSNKGYRPQIYKKDLRPCILPRVMALSAMGLKLKVFGFFADHTCKKQMWNKCAPNLCLPRAFYASLRSDCSRRRWHTHQIPWLFWLWEKTRRPANWAPCQDKNGAGSGISLVHLCYRLISWRYLLSLQCGSMNFIFLVLRKFPLGPWQYSIFFCFFFFFPTCYVYYKYEVVRSKQYHVLIELVILDLYMYIWRTVAIKWLKIPSMEQHPLLLFPATSSSLLPSRLPKLPRANSWLTPSETTGFYLLCVHNIFACWLLV